MRIAMLALAAAGLLGASDPGSWVANAGGAVSRDRNGDIVAVDLRASWVTDSDLSELAGLPKLSQLDLSMTRITDHGLQQLKTAPVIAELDLYYDELITDAGLAAVKGWKRLKRLNARGTKVTDLTLQQLANVTSLEALNVGYALITDVGLDALASLPNLKELAIGGNKLTDAGLQPLRQMPGLTYLDLAGTQRTDSGLWSVSLTEPGLDAVATLKELRHLRLNGTLVSGPGLEKLRALTKLERLDLERCKRVGDDAAPVLESFRSLRRLDVAGTGMTPKGIAALRQSRPDCVVLDGRLDGAPAADDDSRD